MKKGIIVSGLCRLTDSLYYNIRVSAFGRALTSYDTEQKALEHSALVGKMTALGNKLNTKTLKYAISNGCKESVLVNAVLNFTNSLLGSRINQYGIFAFFIGMYNIILYLLSELITINTYGFENGVIGVLGILISIPMLLSKKSLAHCISESVICDVLLFRLLGIEKRVFDREASKNFRITLFPILTATVMSLISLFVPFGKLFGVLCVVLLMYLTLISPESGIVLIIVAIPFAEHKLLALSIVFILICYLIKVSRGKRTLKFELNDYAVFAFGFILITGSIFSCNMQKSFDYSLRLIAYMCIYFLVVNTVKTKRWIHRMCNAVLFSTLSAVLIALMQKIAVSVDFLLVEDFFAQTLKGSFEYPEVLSAFLLLGVFYMLANSIENANRIRKVFCFICFVCTVIAIYYTKTPFALFAFVIGLILFLLIYSNRVVIALLSFVVILPFSKYIFSSDILLGVKEVFDSAAQSLQYRIKVWEIALKIARDYFFSGCGTGTFADIYAKYAAEGMESLPSAYNVYIQTVIENGIIGLICLIALMFIFAQSSFNFFAKQSSKNSVFANAGFCSVFSIFLLGFASNIWFEPKVFLFFWFVMGVTMAIKREGVKTSMQFDKSMGGILFENEN